MRGVSAEGMATSVERVESLAEQGDAGQLGDELFAVAGVLQTQPSLRRAMTDPSAASEAKSGLARSVFGDRLSSATVDAVATAAAARWSSTGDFVAAVEHLGVLALVISAEHDGHLSELEDELFRFGRVVAAAADLRDAVTNKQVPVDHRQSLVHGLLDGRASPTADRLAVQAVASGHRSFEAALEEYQRVAAERQQRIVAVVRSAVALHEEERDRLTAALSRHYGRDVHLNVVVEPEVLGGIRVELGDDVIDGTVAGRLDDARRRMTN